MPAIVIMVIADQTTERHISEEWNLQKHRCENHRSLSTTALFEEHPLLYWVEGFYDVII